MVGAGSVVLAWEWSRMSVPDRLAAVALPMAATFVIAVIAAGGGQMRSAVAVVVMAAVALLFLSGRSGWVAAGVGYLGLACVSLVWLRNGLAAGQFIVLWLFIVVWASDIGAYATGRLVGGPKLAPRISPNKTWSGFFGGLGLASVGGFFLLTGLDLMTGPYALFASAGLSLVAQAGDLLESWIKRRFGVKDTGKLIPGHGGLLDRADSLIMASLVTALFAAASGVG